MYVHIIPPIINMHTYFPFSLYFTSYRTLTVEICLRILAVDVLVVILVFAAFFAP